MLLILLILLTACALGDGEPAPEEGPGAEVVQRLAQAGQHARALAAEADRIRAICAALEEAEALDAETAAALRQALLSAQARRADLGQEMTAAEAGLRAR